MQRAPAPNSQAPLLKQRLACTVQHNGGTDIQCVFNKCYAFCKRCMAKRRWLLSPALQLRIHAANGLAGKLKGKREAQNQVMATCKMLLPTRRLQSHS